MVKPVMEVTVPNGPGSIVFALILLIGVALTLARICPEIGGIAMFVGIIGFFAVNFDPVSALGQPWGAPRSNEIHEHRHVHQVFQEIHVHQPRYQQISEVREITVEQGERTVRVRAGRTWR